MGRIHANASIKNNARMSTISSVDNDNNQLPTKDKVGKKGGKTVQQLEGDKSLSTKTGKGRHSISPSLADRVVSEQTDAKPKMSRSQKRRAQRKRSDEKRKDAGLEPSKQKQKNKMRKKHAKKAKAKAKSAEASTAKETAPAKSEDSTIKWAAKGAARGLIQLPKASFDYLISPGIRALASATYTVGTTFGRPALSAVIENLTLGILPQGDIEAISNLYAESANLDAAKMKNTYNYAAPIVDRVATDLTGKVAKLAEKQVGKFIDNAPRMLFSMGAQKAVGIAVKEILGESIGSKEMSVVVFLVTSEILKAVTGKGKSTGSLGRKIILNELFDKGGGIKKKALKFAVGGALMAIGLR